MKYTTILILLLISSLIVSYAQTGDTVTCYNTNELKHITARVVRANECDALLNLSEAINHTLNLQITNLEYRITIQDSIILLKSNNITDYSNLLIIKDEQLADKNKEVKELIKKNKWIKTGWIATGVLSIVLVVIASVF